MWLARASEPERLRRALGDTDAGRLCGSRAAGQVTVTVTCIAAPLATSVAELTLIAGVLVALADARAAVASAAGEAVAASAATGISVAPQAMTATAVRRFGDRVWS